MGFTSFSQTLYFDTTEAQVHWDNNYTKTVTIDNSEAYVKMYEPGSYTGEGTFTVNSFEIFTFENNDLQNGYFDTTLILNNGDVLLFTQNLNTSGLYLVDLTFTELLDIGVEDLKEQLNFKVYPNPTTDVLKFEIDTFETVEFQIYNNNGQMVKSGILENTLYVNDLTNGMYIINFNIYEVSFSERIIKS